MSDQQLGVNPWTYIWTHPRETIRAIVNFNPKYRFIILSFLYGLPMLFYWAQDLSLGATTPILGIIIGSVVLATFVGMLSMTIGSALLLWTGKWLGGKATYYPIRAAISWSCVPYVYAIIIWAVLIFLFREQLFLDTFPQQDLSQGLLFSVLGLVVLQLILIVWSFILAIKGLAEVQGFSAWKALLNMVIPFVMFMIAVFVCFFLVYMITMVVAG